MTGPRPSAPRCAPNGAELHPVPRRGPALRSRGAARPSTSGRRRPSSRLASWQKRSGRIVELEPVAHAVVEQAALRSGDDVVDLACGTGNAALLAAGRGARVVGVDAAPRLLDVARARAQAQGVALDLREGDLLDLPIDAMLGASGRIVGRITQAPRPQRFAWSDSAVLAPLAATAGLTLDATVRDELPIRASSPEAYVAAGQQHPMALAVRSIIEQGGAGGELQEAMTSVLREAIEDPSGFLVHSPYVVHQLSR